MRTLPPALLRHSVFLELPKEIDGWKRLTSAQNILLTRVYVQHGQALHQTLRNEEARMRAELWYDCRLSAPKGLDLVALFYAAQQVGRRMICRIDGAEYSVDSVELLTDGRGRAHHYHMEMDAR